MADVQPSEQSASTPNHTADIKQDTVIVAPRPWYASPWFWGILLFIAVLALLAWLFWLQWQAHEARLQQEQALVLTQENTNAGLAAEIARLKALLAEEPCVIKERLQDEPLGESLMIPHHEKAAPPAVATAPSPEAAAQNNAGAKSTAEAPPPMPAPNDDATSQNQPTSIAQKLENATVLVLSQEPSGLQMGTGFFIAPGIVLTNQHVVGSGKGNLYVVGTFEGTAVKAKALAISPDVKRDYAILQVPVTTVSPLQLTTHVERTEKVSTWGFPSAVTTNDPKFKNLMDGSDTKAPDVIYSEGTVSVIQDQNPKLIVHTAIVSQGNSGGPLVNEQGDVVGINTYIHMDKQSYRQSSLSIVTEDIIAFLKEHSIPYTLASGNKE